MKIWTVFIGVFFIMLASAAHACEPCARTLTLQESYDEADLVIVGQKAAEGPRTDSGEGYGGPDWIEVRIKQVLKGGIEAYRIKVNSWDGMCSYGIVVEDDKDYVMLLKRRKGHYDDVEFDAVNYGCAVTAYPWEDVAPGFID